MSDQINPEFPCSLTISIPFPTPHLASTALKALQVDEELSPLVHRSFSTASASELPTDAMTTNGAGGTGGTNGPSHDAETADKTVLLTHYKAATNRMLRVSVNGFFESVAVVLQVMEELDLDVLAASGH